MRLVEVRLLDGPNVYHLEPTVKVEVLLGRARDWSGERLPLRGALVRLGARVPAREAPERVRGLARWTARLHRISGADAWLEREAVTAADGPIREADARPRRRRVPVTIHRSSEPGHWVVAFPWRERERAEAIARASFELAIRGLEPDTVLPAGGRGEHFWSHPVPVARALGRIASAGRTPPAWIRDDERRVPVVSISGTNGKSTTTRMITHILQCAGERVGTTTSDGVLIDEVLVEPGDLTGPMGARRVLADPGVTVAVLETARGGLVLRGMGYESNEVSVLTNVSADHMDLHGLHTLPELAEVKSTICRVTRASGTVVLNAEDDLVAAVARGVRARVCLFGLHPGRGRPGARIRRALARGGRAMTLETIAQGAASGRAWIVEREGRLRHPIVPIDEVPSTLLGLARHNVANALAATAAARALGASRAACADGLRDYAPSADQAPGRLNLYSDGRRLVIVDFAHNEAGLAAVLDVAEALAGDRMARRGRAWVEVIVGTAGDRPDDALRAIGRAAARRADMVAVKETLGYLRGRTRDSVVAELRAGMAQGGSSPGDVPVHEDEVAAVRVELTSPGRAGGPLPGILVVMCHAGREAVVGVLEGLGFASVTPADPPSLREMLGA